MPRKRASRSRTRTGGKFARKLTLEVLEDRRLLASDFNLFKDVNPFGPGSSPTDLVAVGSVLYFTANDGISSWELWKSDGTEAGTLRVKDIRAGSESSDLRYLTNVGGTLFFAGSDGVSGAELWKSDGTDVGTVRVKDISAASSSPSNLANVDGTLFFAANDGVSGVELWKSDGTEAGTVLVKDFTGDSASSIPSQITEANGRVFVVATTAQYGSEIWIADPNPPSLTGDYNTNGVVDAADYVLWRKTLGSTTDLRANGDNTGASAGIIDQADYNAWRSNFRTSAQPAIALGDYNTNDVVDAADYVLWRKTLGSTTDLRANGDDTGASAGVIDQADYVVWRSNFGVGLGAGAGGGASSEARAASGEELRIADLGLGIESIGPVAVTSSVVVTENAVASMVGDSPLPRPSPRGRGSNGAAAFTGEPDLLLLAGAGWLDERLSMADEVPIASIDDTSASAQADELMALDAVFTSVGQNLADGWGVGG